ncbi:MAG: hypothetical protein EXQ81_02430 [Thermoleophilia bacterium]|nr:hypothetical protein [Thermoleophilia bacterium]
MVECNGDVVLPAIGGIPRAVEECMSRPQAIYYTGDLPPRDAARLNYLARGEDHGELAMLRCRHLTALL